MSKIVTRIFLAVSLALALGVAGFAVNGINAGDTSAWGTLAAVLAVITSVVSAWGAQRVVELEEDKLMPYPHPQFDATSRYGLMLFKVTNFGGSAAHNIRFIWDKPLKTRKGETVRFGPDDAPHEISILAPGQEISKVVDGHVQFFQIEGPHVYRGQLEYEDSHGRKKKLPFLVDAESLRHTPSYVDEGVRTQWELQKLPAVLQRLCDQVETVAEQLERKDSVE